MIDSKIGVDVVENYMRYMTHQGKAFMLSLSSAIDAFDIASPLAFLFTTPDTNVRCAMNIHGSANTPAIIQIYEDTDVLAQFNVTGGTGITPANRNRNSSEVSVATVTHTPTITVAAAAALIHSKYAAKAGIEESFTIILKQNTEYLFRFLSVGDNNEGSLNLSWCEYIDLAWSDRVKE